MHCMDCGSSLDPRSQICTSCGRRQSVFLSDGALPVVSPLSSVPGRKYKVLRFVAEMNWIIGLVVTSVGIATCLLSAKEDVAAGELVGGMVILFGLVPVAGGELITLLIDIEANTRPR